MELQRNRIIKTKGFCAELKYNLKEIAASLVKGKLKLESSFVQLYLSRNYTKSPSLLRFSSHTIEHTRLLFSSWLHFILFKSTTHAIAFT